MSAAHDLLALANRHNIELSVVADRLRLRAPIAPPPEVVSALRDAKPIIMAALAIVGSLDEERAGIIEYDGGAPRNWAEGLARLHPDRAPADVPLARWRLFLDDCGRFLDSAWAARAQAMGWGPADFFGCDRNKPFARVDQAGLLWLLAGASMVALSGETATIRTPTGARQTYRRKPSNPGRVLAWELRPVTPERAR